MEVTQTTGRLGRLTIFVGTFVASLYSHGPYIEMAGMLIIIMYVGLRTLQLGKLRASSVQLAAAWLCIISAFFTYFVFSGDLSIAKAHRESAFTNYIFMCVLVVFVASLRSLLYFEPSTMRMVLRWIILANCFAIFAQTAWLVVFGSYIDLVQPITGEASRYLNYEGLNPFFSYRPTGFFTEPSNASAVILVLLIGYLLTVTRLNEKPSRIVMTLCVVAMLATQSTAGVIQAIALIGVLFLAQGRRGRFAMSILLAVGFAAGSTLVAAYFGSFMEKWGESSEIRFALLNYIYGERTGLDFIFGHGPFGYEQTLFDMAQLEQSQTASVNDAGLLNFLVVQFGICGLLIVAAIFVKMKKSLATALMLGVIMSTKLSYMYPVLYCGLLPLVMREPRMRRNDLINSTTA